MTINTTYLLCRSIAPPLSPAPDPAMDLVLGGQRRALAACRTSPLAEARARERRERGLAFGRSGPIWRRRRMDKVDREELASEGEPVSSAAAAVEYVRNGKREFFVDRVEADGRGKKQWVRRKAGARFRDGDRLTVRETSTTVKTWRGKACDRFLRYFLPDGYPHSVGSDYTAYTRWRLMTFFFGGSVGVFSTQGLLLAVGVGRQSAAPIAAALQWVIRDGMGRMGRLVFGQVGPGFDAETKQYRLMASVVLNLSCALESITPLVPQFFLPLACLANMAKG